MRFRLMFFGILLCCLAVSCVCAQQTPVNAVYGYEKVHLHLDRNVFGSGETVWFKAYIQSGDSSGNTSSVLHVELQNEDSIISYQRLPIVLAVTNGQFVLNDSLATGWYSIRAYTDMMLRQKTTLYFQSAIYVHGKNSRQTHKQEMIGDSVLVAFFPEGGSLVKGLESTVAFKVNDHWGNPVKFSGVVRTDKGDSVTTIETYHDGMGEFKLKPLDGLKYFVASTIKNTENRYYLPAPINEGVVLSLINHPEGFYFELMHSVKSRKKNPSFIVGTMLRKEVFRRKISDADNHFHGVLKTKQLNSGILTVSVLNEDGIPLAERLVFVNNNEYRQAVQIIPDTIDFGTKAKNHLRIALADTVRGSLSISVTNADFGYGKVRPASIISDLLLKTELKGMILNPDWYFLEGNDSVSTAMDLLMLTQGWRNYQWSSQDKSDGFSGQGEISSFITIRGRALLRGTKNPLSNARLMVVLSAKGLTNNIILTETDKSGNFTIDSLLFFGRAKLYFAEQRVRGKARFIDIALTEDPSLELHFSPKRNEQQMLTRQQTIMPGMSDSIIYTLEAINRAEGKMMEGVTVTAKMKTAEEKLEEEYTAGAFSTNAFVTRVIDLVNTNEPIVHSNIFEYLNSRIPGLVIMEPDYTKKPPDPAQPGFDPRNDPTKLRLFYRQMPSASSLGNPPMIVYLNEIETDPDVIATIPAAEIALIKIYSSFVAATGSGSGGAMAIYTKKSKDSENPKGSTISYEGFSVIKEFFAPNYKTDPALLKKPDTRITLDWRPNIFVNNVDPVIPVSFYNSDRTKRFRIVVEGMTTSGKLISVEQVIGGMNNQ